MTSKLRTILVLGSGLMTDAIITYLLSSPKVPSAPIQNRIHIASNVLEEAKVMAEKKGLDRCTYSEVNVKDGRSLKPLISASDIVISYTPAFLHPHVA